MSRANKEEKDFLGNIKKGALHAQLGIPQDKKIPMKTLKMAKKKAEKTDNSKLLKRTTLAINMRKWNKK